MGGYYGFPEGNPSYDFGNAYDQYVRRNYQAEPNFDISDPEVQKYQEMSGRAPRSEGIITDYLNERPDREEYNPSWKRKLAAFLLGTFSGSPAAAQANASKVAWDPYNVATDEWKAEGLNLGSRAKAADDAQNRELSALKFGLTQRYKAQTDKDKLNAGTQSRGISFGRTGATLDATAQRDKDRQDQIDWMNAFREKSLDSLNSFREQGLGLRERALDERGTGSPSSLRVAPPQDPIKLQENRDKAIKMTFAEMGGQPSWKPIVDFVKEQAAQGLDPVRALDSAPVDPAIRETFKKLFMMRVDDLAGGGR